jgi:HK97 family phage portal protein
MLGFRRVRAQPESGPISDPQQTPGHNLAELVPTRTPWPYEPAAIPPVMAARHLLSELAGNLPLVAVRSDRSTGRTTPVTPTPSLLDQPDPRITGGQFVRQLVNDLTRCGRAFIWARPDWQDSTGQQTGVAVASPDDVGGRYDEWGHLVGFTYRASDWEPDQLLHLPYWQDRDPLGYGPLQQGAGRLAELAGLYRYAASQYLEGAPPSSVITLGGFANPTAAKGTGQKVTEAHYGVRTPLVLWGGTSVDFPQANAVEADVVRMLGEARAEVALMFNLPPQFLNAPIASSLTYATMEAEWRLLLATALQPILVRIEDAFSALLPRGQSARFDYAELLRTDAKTRADIYGSAIDKGWLTTEEVRAAEGMAPLGEPAQPRVDVSPDLPAVTRRIA